MNSHQRFRQGGWGNSLKAQDPECDPQRAGKMTYWVKSWYASMYMSSNSPQFTGIVSCCNPDVSNPSAPMARWKAKTGESLKGDGLATLACAVVNNRQGL